MLSAYGSLWQKKIDSLDAHSFRGVGGWAGKALRCTRRKASRQPSAQPVASPRFFQLHACAARTVEYHMPDMPLCKGSRSTIFPFGCSRIPARRTFAGHVPITFFRSVGSKCHLGRICGQAWRGLLIVSTPPDADLRSQATVQQAPEVVDSGRVQIRNRPIP